MAIVSITLKGPTVDLTQGVLIADENLPRIITFLMASPYGKVTENIARQVPDPNWNPGVDETEKDRPMIEIQEWVTRQASLEEMVANFAQATINTIFEQTVQYDRAKAAAEAAAAIAPIVPIE